MCSYDKGKGKVIIMEMPDLAKEMWRTFQRKCKQDHLRMNVAPHTVSWLNSSITLWDTAFLLFCLSVFFVFLSFCLFVIPSFSHSVFLSFCLFLFYHLSALALLSSSEFIGGWLRWLRGFVEGRTNGIVIICQPSSKSTFDGNSCVIVWLVEQW